MPVQHDLLWEPNLLLCLLCSFVINQVDLACTAGSPLGAKLASAFETCLGGEEALKPEEVVTIQTCVVNDLIRIIHMLL